MENMITTPDEDQKIHALKMKIDRFDFHKTAEIAVEMKFLHTTLVRVTSEANRLQRENQELHERIRARR